MPTLVATGPPVFESPPILLACISLPAVFRIVLLGVRRLVPEERNEAEQAVAGANASFDALDQTTKERLAGELRGFEPLNAGTLSDLAVYTVVEEDGRTSEE